MSAPYRTRAIAAHAMPYGVFGTLEGGRFTYDPSNEGKGGVLVRAPGRGNDCEAGEEVLIQTDREIMVLFPAGATITVRGSPVRVPFGHQRMVYLRGGRICG